MMYSKGQVLKSRMRSESAPLFVMICDNCTIGGGLDQTEHHFRAVVLFDGGESNELEPGMVDNSFNKGKWAVSDLLEVAEAVKGLKYRLLRTGEPIESNDEWLTDDCVNWRPVSSSGITRAMVGRHYLPANYVPFRRPAL